MGGQGLNREGRQAKKETVCCLICLTVHQIFVSPEKRFPVRLFAVFHTDMVAGDDQSLVNGTGYSGLSRRVECARASRLVVSA